MISNQFYHFSAVCCCIWAIAQALPSHHQGASHHQQLDTVPSLSDYSHIEYPHLDVIDLGETQKYVPEKEIKVTRIIKITKPYPVEVPVKVPFPVPVVQHVPVEVTKVVKVPEHSHVDVVKSVQVHASVTNEHVPSGGSHHEQWSQVNTNDHQEQQQQQQQQHEHVPVYNDNAHFSSEGNKGDGGHGDESNNYASLIAQQAMEYQQNFHQNQAGDNYQVNEGHHQ